MTVLQLERVSATPWRLGRQPLFRDVSFSLDAGSVAAVVGPNGSGKSTFLRVAAGIDPPGAGTVHRPAALGFVPESTPTSLRMPVGVWLRGLAAVRGLHSTQARRAVGRALDTWSLADHVDDRVDRLSKGTRQRAILAQAFLGDPPLVVLDEPQSGLDALGEEQLAGLLARPRAAVLLATHLREIVPGGARWFAVRDGALVERAPDAPASADGASVRIVYRTPGGTDDEVALVPAGTGDRELRRLLDAGCSIREVTRRATS